MHQYEAVIKIRQAHHPSHILGVARIMAVSFVLCPPAPQGRVADRSSLDLRRRHGYASLIPEVSRFLAEVGAFQTAAVSPSLRIIYRDQGRTDTEGQRSYSLSVGGSLSDHIWFRAPGYLRAWLDRQKPNLLPRDDQHASFLIRARLTSLDPRSNALSICTSEYPVQGRLPRYLIWM